MPKTLSSDDIQQFREAMRRVAENAFATRGAQGVTMRELAKELGCSAMTPYRYFRDKDEILAMVRAAAFNRFAARLEAAAQRAPATDHSIVSDAYVAFALDEPHAYRLMFDLTQPDAAYPELTAASQRAWQLLEVHFEQLPRTLRRSREFRVGGVRLRQIEHQAVGVRLVECERHVGVADDRVIGRGRPLRRCFEPRRKAVECGGADHRKDFVFVAEVAIGRHRAATQLLGQFAHRHALCAARGERVFGHAPHGFAKLLDVVGRECFWHARRVKGPSRQFTV
ncbi:MAG: hypothetical protein QOC89_1939 [Paraburkholderia sp.]|nr:hypothetical protein [Paraburkholderia sp.]